jgi:predicted Fe-Mo cluster-binding NifX family protein
MKIAITSTGKTLNSQVDPRFGRAVCFIIIDTEKKDSFKVFDNENITASGGTGISSAKFVIDNGAEAVLTGNCGPNAERTLTAAGVKLYTGVTGTVAEAIKLFKNDKLTQASGPNVELNFGMEK